MNGWVFDNMKKPHTLFVENLICTGVTMDMDSVCSLHHRTTNPENSGTFSGKYYLSESLIVSQSRPGEKEEAEEKKRKCTRTEGDKWVTPSHAVNNKSILGHFYGGFWPVKYKKMKGRS